MNNKKDKIKITVFFLILKRTIYGIKVRFNQANINMIKPKIVMIILYIYPRYFELF